MPTTNLLGIFVFSFLISFGAVVSPGPVSAAVISEAPRTGWRVGPLVAAGHTFLELLLVLLISIGLSTLLNDPVVIDVISLAGGVVLFLMGLAYVLGATRGSIALPEGQSSGDKRSMPALVLLGMLTTVSNPYWYTWWITVAAGYLLQAKALSVFAIGAFYFGHISADFGWDTTLAVATSAGTRWLTLRRYRLLILITGLFMIYLGIQFVLNILN
jgi:threonine/homoserine/homoserine lactone efflux protein